MKPATFHLAPIDGIITVAVGHTPPSHVHRPDETYCAYFWLSQLGPTSYLAWKHLAAWTTDDETATVAINYDELARSLGTSPGRLTKALQRLAGFHLAYTLPTQPDTLYVKRRAPTLSPGQLTRLAERCPTLAACHDEQQHAA